MEQYHVPVIYNKIKPGRTIRAHVPGSKSITNRALLIAALADGTSRLTGALFSEDSVVFLEGLRQLGFAIREDDSACTVEVTGLGGPVPVKEGSVYVGSAGTAARFLTAYLGMSEGCFHMTASPQMERRPMAPLLETLSHIGTQFTFHKEPGHFPFTISSKGISGPYSLTVDIRHSSQFLSALLISSVISDDDVEISIEGSHGMAYIDMTAAMMSQFGVTVEQTGERRLLVRGSGRYTPGAYSIEPDVSAACYFYAMCPLLGIPAKVDGVKVHSIQGDIWFLKILEQMGCRLKETEDGLWLYPPADGVIRGITADLSACSDQTMTLAAIAPFADRPVTITGIGHIRYQESNRLEAVYTELVKRGIQCRKGEDWLEIHPGSPAPGAIRTYDDHRMAMAFTLMGLRAEGIIIEDPLCCRKTFAGYYDRLAEVIKHLTD